MMKMMMMMMMMMMMIQKEDGKKLKHKNLNIEIWKMWNMNSFVIPVIMGPLELLLKEKNIWKQYQESFQ